MDIKIIILTALIGVITVFSHVSKPVVREKSTAREDRSVLPI